MSPLEILYVICVGSFDCSCCYRNFLGLLFKGDLLLFLGQNFHCRSLFTELHKYVASRSCHAIFASRVDVRHLDNAWLYWNSSFWSFFLSRKSY